MLISGLFEKGIPAHLDQPAAAPAAAAPQAAQAPAAQAPAQESVSRHLLDSLIRRF